MINQTPEARINTWPKFAKHVRSRGCNLLNKLDDYENAVLVTGCQRSGTTILSRVITNSDGMVRFQFGKDDELDAAMILSGMVPHREPGRYCFQTTYLNECYEEYFQHNDKFKIIWVLRTPHSVVYSMLYHWKRFALNELFQGVGEPYINKSKERLYNKFGLLGLAKIYRACAAYNGKLAQLPVILDRLGSERVYVTDYSDLINTPNKTLESIYQFIDLPYSEDYSKSIHTKSEKKATKLSDKEKLIISEECDSMYHSCRQYLSGTLK